MNREILFRGKRLDNNEWVYGFYSNAKGENGRFHYIQDEISFVRVDPSTVGQYTGITDKNDKKIFEGDIIDLGNKVPSVVVFDEDAASFYLKPRGLFSQAFNDLYNVIGNIYDNKELIPQEDV